MSTSKKKSRKRLLLFLHGAGGSKQKWRAIAPFIEKSGKDFEWVDLTGHGEDSTSPPSSIEGYAAHLNEKYGNRNLIVIGHSMGGLIALAMAKQNPRVKGIIFVASHSQLPVHPKIIATLQQGKFPESLFLASYGKHPKEDLLEEERKELFLNPIEVTTADFIHCDNFHEGEEDLAHLSIPILALYGAEDRLLPQNAQERIQGLYPHLQKKIIAGAGHYLMLEKPQEVAKEILKFRIKRPRPTTKERTEINDGKNLLESRD